MGRLTHLESSTGLLCSAGPVTLLSILISQTEPAATPGATIDFHDVATVGGLGASNKVISLVLSAQNGIGFSHLFDGAHFAKGLVVKCSEAVPVTVEWE